jgi:hypothetical protein
MKAWLAVLAIAGALALSAPAMAQPSTPNPAPSASAEPAPPGVELTAPDFSNTRPEPSPPGFGEVRHYLDPLEMIKIPEDAHWAVPELWTHGDVQLVWHSVGRWWVGGTGVTSVGYAIQVPGHDAYWALDEDKIALFQVNNVLPKTLPKGEISPTNLLLRGYSLYILIAVVLGILVVGGLLSLIKPKPKLAA